jgi:hypothetical protein
VGHGERRPQASGISAADIDDQVIILRRELADLRTQGGALEADRRVAWCAELSGAQLREQERGALFIAIDQEHLSTITGTSDGEVERQHCLSDTALDVPYGQNHDVSLRHLGDIDPPL